ncbi:MAG: DUF370 domain-containing protein [Oscillospiraceae bacterium]|nr:DUF370 domain-containing protein [Oscillospiraceae bacterium]
MFLHLGNDHMVEIKNIVAIFDIENASTSKITKEFLALAGKSKRVISCSYELPKSFVVTLDKDFTELVYISAISAATLKKRLKNITDGKF